MAETVLVTGAAGFIGSHLCEWLIDSGARVVGIDSFDPFYSAEIKRRNLSTLLGHSCFALLEVDIRDLDGMQSALDALNMAPLDAIVHLAARAGVRPSIQEPLLYSQVNIDGTVAMLELARQRGARRFVFGSSSSVYGNNPKVPFSETDPVDHPISPYAATKRSGELLCHTYHHLYGLSVVCLRFFTVYGPRQRPDLAIHKFARLMAAGRPIPMFGDGSTERDYTYIDDIVEGVHRALFFTERSAPVFEIINLGGSRTTSLRRLIELISEAMGVDPSIEQHPAQPGDVQRTFADISRARSLLGYEPTTSIEEGIPRFVEWFKEHVDRG
jgi:UDP-glucuronate 4-epimerase